mgnify:CR=1 FL=1
MTMKIDLTQPTIKVENAKGVSYTGKITKFTFIGSGASIDFMTKDAVLTGIPLVNSSLTISSI